MLHRDDSVPEKISAREDTDTNRRRVRAWMRLHARDYDNATHAAEECANDIQEDGMLWDEDDPECTIPEYIFEEAGNFYHIK